MKTIGLIGGMSWESSIGYYRIINEATRDKLGGLHSAKSKCTKIKIQRLLFQLIIRPKFKIFDFLRIVNLNFCQFVLMLKRI